MKKPRNFGHDGVSVRQYFSTFSKCGKLDVERLHSKLKITRKQKYIHKLYCTCHIICWLQRKIKFDFNKRQFISFFFFQFKKLCPVNAFCLVWMRSICKSCKVQNQAIKKDCTLHYLYISLGHSENIRHIIFRITDIMPFHKSTNSLHILPSPGNCPTSQLFFPPLLVW